MPITVVATGPIPNVAVPNQNQRSSAHDVIAMLQYADIWRGAGTLRQDARVRVDMQGVIAGPPAQQNLQVQLNGVGGNSTIAHANVSTTIQTNDPVNQRGALNKVISALNQSLDNAQSFLVNGSIP